MEPIDIFQRIFFKHIYTFSKVCGAAVIMPDFEPSWVTVFWVSLNIFYGVCSLYTFAAYDYETVWKCITTVGLEIQGLSKYYSMLTHARDVSAKVAFVKSIYRMNESHKTGVNYQILLRRSQLAWLVCRIGTVIICLTCTCFLPITLLSNVLTGQREPILHAYLPFVDIGHLGGYMTHFVFHFFTLALAATGTCAVDLLLVMLVVHMVPMTEIFCGFMDTLNHAVVVPANRDSKELHRFFRNIILVHKDICSYIEGLSDIYFFISFAEIYSVGLSLCTMIFCMLTMEWVALYFLSSLMLSKLLVFCVLGTTVEITTDQIYNSLLQSNWYMLPMDLQRMFMLMVARAQKPSVLMAGTIPLNLDTFVNVIKTVYSVGMLLIESVQ